MQTKANIYNLNLVFFTPIDIIESKGHKSKLKNSRNYSIINNHNYVQDPLSCLYVVNNSIGAFEDRHSTHARTHTRTHTHKHTHTNKHADIPHENDFKNQVQSF